MKALILKEYMHLEIADVPAPQISAPDDVLIRIKATAICGSDVHGIDGSTGRRQPPLTMGHEAAGLVAAVGPGVKNVATGDRVTFDSTIWCGECHFCRRGEVNLCDNRRVLGVSCDEYRREGTFAEYVVVPERIIYRLPESVAFEEAALTEPVSVAMHAFRITNMQPGESAAVVGSGLIGLLLIQIIRSYSPHLIFAFDTDSQRRAAALRAGADFALDPADPASQKKVLDMTEGRGVDRVFEAVGASAPIATAVAAARKGGTVTLIGNISPKAEIPLQSVVTREISLIGSCAISGEYPVSLDLMASHKIDAKSVISAIAPLEEGPLWFERLYRREPGLLKVVLVP
ncbi:Alcohol dehydrogenase GroES domain protein [uncultured spirochete]|uniref:Alcohol dehydrogenase GroES domain protein n=1 Tax=uncultured spirochete TaxID=156406 RepID=A0A3P3XU38_9SPIR|nr:Alcohol dehydrogenase GroES domain protein [uncultured spirochete]